MSSTKTGKLRVAILTGSKKLIVSSLLQNDFDVVGISEVNDDFRRMVKPRQWVEKFYWRVVKREEPPYLSLYAIKNKIPYVEKSSLNKEEYIKWLNTVNPDVLILHLAPILSSDIFTIPNFGTLNIHPSLLPKYRGVNPYFWMYYQLDMTAGITLHYIDDGIDTGEIVGQSSYTIKLGTPASEVSKKLILDHAMPMLFSALRDLERVGKLSTVSQPSNSPTQYAKRLSNDDYSKMLRSENLTLEHFWHVLNSNDQWRDVFLPKINNFNRYRWSLGRVERKTLPPPYCETGKDDCGYFIKHKQGVVYLKQELSIKEFIKSLF